MPISISITVRVAKAVFRNLVALGAFGIKAFFGYDILEKVS
jgi:hypothetical protein